MVVGLIVHLYRRFEIVVLLYGELDSLEFGLEPVIFANAKFLKFRGTSDIG